ncbi:MAG: hypothetical protein ABL986_00995 [Vicinamibacterales bacterium]
MARQIAFVVLVSLLHVSPAWAADPPALVKAHALYNAGDFEGAIQVAAPLAQQATAADAVALLIGRARLEQYRQSADVTVLEDARVALSSVKGSALPPRQQVELLIGMGQTLYFGDVFGGAAELFDSALGRGELLSERDRGALLDWWATSLDRQAQLLSPDLRRPVFDRIAARMETELRQDPGSGPANYWLVVGARGVGDVVRAWDAAVAGWVRAALNPTSVATVRADIDRLVTEALAIELGRSRGGPEPQDAINATRADWELVKSQWK